jgi:hypothetical protein
MAILTNDERDHLEHERAHEYQERPACNQLVAIVDRLLALAEKQQKVVEAVGVAAQELLGTGVAITIPIDSEVGKATKDQRVARLLLDAAVEAGLFAHHERSGVQWGRHYRRIDMRDEELPSICLGCGSHYETFVMDVLLPDDEWRGILGRDSGNGLLCCNCILARGKAAGHPVAFLSFRRAAARSAT